MSGAVVLLKGLGLRSFFWFRLINPESTPALLVVAVGCVDGATGWLVAQATSSPSPLRSHSSNSCLVALQAGLLAAEERTELGGCVHVDTVLLVLQRLLSHALQLGNFGVIFDRGWGT